MFVCRNVIKSFLPISRFDLEVRKYQVVRQFIVDARGRDYLTLPVASTVSPRCQHNHLTAKNRHPI
jgi:hypothetical protein